MALTSASPSRGLARRVSSIIGVSVGPGQTTLTRMLCRATSRATALLKPMMPAFAPEYTTSPDDPTRPASTRHHSIEHGSGARDHPLQVDGDHTVPRLLGALHERLHPVPAGAAH